MSIPVSMMGLSSEQQQVVFLATRVCSVLGLLGSLFVVCFFFSVRRHRRTLRHQLVVWLAVAEIPTFFVTFLGPWGLTHSVLCQIQGALAQYAIAGGFWVAALVTHSFVGVVLLWPEERAASLVPLYHVVCWGFPVLTAVGCLCAGVLGPTLPWCYILPQYVALRYALTSAPLWLLLAYIFTITTMLLHKVTHTYSLGGVRIGGASPAVLLQVCSFGLIFVVCWLPGTANRVLQTVTGDSVFVLALLHGIMSPLQGLLNCIAFTGPTAWRYLRARGRCTDSTGTGSMTPAAVMPLADVDIDHNTSVTMLPPGQTQKTKVEDKGARVVVKAAQTGLPTMAFVYSEHGQPGGSQGP